MSALGLKVQQEAFEVQQNNWEGMNRDRDKVHITVTKTRLIILGAIVFSIIASLILGLTISKRISIPIASMVEVTQAIAGGDLDQTVRVKVSDEVGALASSFNKMTVALKKAGEEVEERTNDLEKSKKELQEKNDELKSVNEEMQIINEELETRGEELQAANEELQKKTEELEIANEELATLNEELKIINEELEKKTEDLQEAFADLKNTQSQLIQSEKMAALGQLAGGIAHEINNPLSGVLGFSKILIKKTANEKLRKMKEFADFPESLKLIKESSLRCKEIIEKVLIFARQSDRDISLTDINQVIKDTLVLIETHPSRVKIGMVLKLDPDLPKIMANKNQIQQVFMNIALNAYQAMTDGGELKITTGLSEEDFIEISFTDTGHGISQENINKIFDPFFTTRDVGEGTGLGLSISYRITKDHHGEIKVKSEEGKGTTFSIYLPVKR